MSHEALKLAAKNAIDMAADDDRMRDILMTLVNAAYHQGWVDCAMEPAVMAVAEIAVPPQESMRKGPSCASVIALAINECVAEKREQERLDKVASSLIAQACVDRITDLAHAQGWIDPD